VDGKGQLFHTLHHINTTSIHIDPQEPGKVYSTFTNTGGGGGGMDGWMHGSEDYLHQGLLVGVEIVVVAVVVVVVVVVAAAGMLVWVMDVCTDH